MAAAESDSFRRKLTSSQTRRRTATTVECYSFLRLEFCVWGAPFQMSPVKLQRLRQWAVTHAESLLSNNKEVIGPDFNGKPSSARASQ